MKFFKLNQWLKLVCIILILLSAFILLGHIAPKVFAAPTPAGTPTSVASPAGTPTPTALRSVGTTDLASGGQGLAIPTGGVEISPSISHATLGDTVLAMVNYFLGFLGFLATLAFVYAGVLWILSGGAEEPLTKAKKIVTYASLGLVVVILSFSAVRFIVSSVPTGGLEPPHTDAGGDCKNNQGCGTGEVCYYDNDSELNKCTIPGSAGNACRDNNDCPLNFTCKIETLRCIASATPGAAQRGADSVKSETSEPAYDDGLNNIDETLKGLGSDLDISGLSDEAKTNVDKVIGQGDLDNKIDALKKMLENPSAYGLTDKDISIIENLIGALDRLKILRDQLDDLKKTMPESKTINQAYDDTSSALDELIDAPSDRVKFNRFDTKYKNLKDLIKKFPSAKAVIWATPSTGNVPFTVQFDGLDSVDPTGGTISDYKWTYTDSSGNEVSLGSTPMILHDFTEVNTYAVRLRVSTSQKDADGYKTASDGVAIVRIKAYPPTSQVKFKINGRDAGDLFNVTLKEAQSGLSFDPSDTTAAFGRKIEKYEWFFGDNVTESRNVPTTVVHTYGKAGEYNVKLTVTDNIGTTDKRIVKLFVKSVAADIVISPEEGDVNTTFTFQGVGSRSDDGIINAYAWEIRDKSDKVIKENKNKSFSYKFSKPGEYTIALTVTDITGATDKFAKTLMVSSRPPVANFSFSIPRKNHPNDVEFSASDSYDPDEGDIITYSWDFDGDGNFDVINGKDALITHTYDKVGEYRVKLQVEDAYRQYKQVEKKVSVDSILSGDVVAKQKASKVGESVDFEAKSPNAVAYLWDFGDGTTQSTEDTKASHKYDKVGKFIVRLTFYDIEDNSNTALQHILIGAGDNPVASIDYSINGRDPILITDLCNGQEGSVVSRADKIRFDGRNSINIDGSGRMLSYDWVLPGGEKSNNRDTTYKFSEINREGECFSANLVVRDDATGKLSQKDEIFLKAINELPTVTDFVIIPPTTGTELVTPIKVGLKVVNPKDNDGTIKKFRWWYYRDGFPDEKLGVQTTSAPQTEMTITSYGEPDTTNKYYFVCEVTDNDNGVYSTIERFGEVSYLDIKNGPNLSPVAEFIMDKTTISVGDSITFVSKSYDPQGEKLPNDAYMWDFDGDGEFDDTSTGPQVSRQYNTPGEYTVRLKVVYRGLSSSATKTVFVEATQSLPQAAFIYTVDGTTVKFDASTSRYDPSLTDTTLRYEWDFDINSDANGNGIKDDDVESTDKTPSFTYATKGVYKVKLTVKDMLGMQGVVVRAIDLNMTEAERGKNTFHSLKVSSQKYALTTLDLEIIPATLNQGESADVNARILNADGSNYTGQVFFEVMEGSGQFTPNPVNAVESKASSIFSSSEKGKMRIRVRATGTLYDELIEEATITVK